METHPTHDTWIARVPFPDGSDRRLSARVPCAMQARLGPPKAGPETMLLAEDLSTGGLFIRCTQEVQIGARFSVTLSLPTGEEVYVPEAEVLYNTRLDATGRSGFGARFVSLTHETLSKLAVAARFESDLGRVPRDESSLPATSSMIIGSEDTELPGPVLGPRTRSPWERLPAMPQISDLRLATLRPVSPEVAPQLDEEVLPRPEEVHDTVPPATLKPARADQREIETDRLPEPRVLCAPSHPFQRDDSIVPGSMELDGDEDMHDGIDWAPREAQRHRRSRGKDGNRALVLGVGAAVALSVVLVGAVLIDNAQRHRAQEALLAEPAPRVSEQTQTALTGSQAKLIGVEPVRVEAPAPKPAPAPSNLDRLDAATSLPASTLSGARRAPLPPAPAAAPKVRKPAPVINQASLVLGLAKGARVLRTHVLKEPSRFVIDIAGQKTSPSVVTQGPGHLAARIGMHPDHVRVVIDSPRPIVKGSASQKGDRLEVSLAY